MAKRKKIEIFKLEDRVLYEAAGAVEAVAAEALAEEANPDQQNEISESERQEKEAQSVAKDAGPANAGEPGKTVQEVGGGLFQKKSEQQNTERTAGFCSRSVRTARSTDSRSDCSISYISSGEASAPFRFSMSR